MGPCFDSLLLGKISRIEEERKRRGEAEEDSEDGDRNKKSRSARLSGRGMSAGGEGAWFSFSAANSAEGWERMMDVYRTLQEKFRDVAAANGLLREKVTVRAKVLSTEEAIGNPEEDDFPLQKGRERLMEAEFLDGRGQAFTDRYGAFEGTVTDVVAGRLDNNYRRAVFVATLNAMLRHLGLADKTVHCRDKEPALCAGELASYLESLYKGSGIVQIGFQPRMIDAVSRRFLLRVVDLDPQNIGTQPFGVTVEGPESTKDAIEWADVLLVTGSTLVNGTIGSFLGEKPTIFYGTTIAGAAGLMGWQRFCGCGH